MIRYTELQSDRRKFLALTGLTLPEFQQLLAAFARCYERLYLPDQTLAGRPRQRFAGGGRKGVLHAPEQKLLFLLVYLKTYPLQAVLGELFGLSRSRGVRPHLDVTDAFPYPTGKFNHLSRGTC